MAQVKYTVSGTFAENGKKVYLIDELVEKKIDSTVVANGKFAFSGTADKDALMAVRARISSWTMQFFNDGAARQQVAKGSGDLQGPQIRE